MLIVKTIATTITNARLLEFIDDLVDLRLDIHSEAITELLATQDGPVSDQYAIITLRQAWLTVMQVELGDHCN